MKQTHNPEVEDMKCVDAVVCMCVECQVVSGKEMPECIRVALERPVFP